MSITSANAILTLAVFPLFPIPQQIQGFSADDIYNVPQIRSAEVMMGVDGRLSGGYVFTQIAQTITLMADSESNDLFDTWWTSQQAAGELYEATGLIRLPSISTKYTQTRGFLTGYTPVAQGKRVLQARAYEITWERIAPSPT